MERMPCHYLEGEVELTEERRQHIKSKHPDLIEEHFDCLAQTVAEPDEIRMDKRFPSTRLFSRWFENLKEGKFVVVVVASSEPPEERHWIVTAYIARRLVKGVSEWKRS